MANFYKDPIKMYIQALASSSAGQKLGGNISINQGLVSFKGPCNISDAEGQIFCHNY